MDYKFYEEKVFDYFWEYPNSVFPGFDFYQRNGKLYSNCTLDGEKRNKAKIVVNTRFKNLMPTDNDSRSHTSNGEGGLSVVELYRINNGLITYHDSLKALCALARVDLPADYKKHIEEENRKQSALSAAHAQFVDALFAGPGAAVLDYLTRPKASGGRGYDEDTARKMKLGAVTAENVHLLNAVPGFEDFKNVPALIIPLEIENRLCGFKVRFIKSKGFYNAKDQERNKDLYYLPCWNREDTDTDGADAATAYEITFYNESLFICESETDALHARVKGLNNVCCLSSRTISSEQIKKILAKGYKNAVFCLDTEDGTSAEDQERKQKANETALLTNLKQCAASGLNAYYFNLPAKDYTEKVDFDSFFNTHELTDLWAVLFGMDKDGVKNLKDYAETVVSIAIKRYGTEHGAQRTSVKDYVFAELSGNTTQTRTALGTLAAALGEDQEQTAREYKEYADRRNADQEQKAKEQKDLSFRNALQAYARTADTSKSTSEVLAAIQNVISAHCGHVSDYEQFTHNPPKAKILDLFSLDTDGLKTGYKLYDHKRPKAVEYDLELPAAALTTIAAPTNHGKSKFLQNIILNVLQTHRSKRFLYFNFEESKADKIAQLINNVCGLSMIYHAERDNNKFIKRYLRTASADKAEFTSNAEPTLINAIETVFDYIESDNLIIFAESPETPNITDIEDVENIITANADAHGTALGGVFLDYLQLMSNSKFSGQNFAMYEDICRRLQSLAIKYNIPIVICSQLKRGSKIWDLNNEQLSESKGIENTSNTVIMLYNSVAGCTVTDSKGQPIDSSKNTIIQGFINEININYNDSFTNFFEPGDPGKIYARCTKSRSALRNAYTVFDFDGASGKILNFDKDKIEDPKIYKLSSPSSIPQSQEPRPAQKELNFDEDQDE